MHYGFPPESFRSRPFVGGFVRLSVCSDFLIPPKHMVVIGTNLLACLYNKHLAPRSRVPFTTNLQHHTTYHLHSRLPRLQDDERLFVSTSSQQEDCRLHASRSLRRHI